MKRRPTKRSVLISGIGGLLILAGATAQSGWLFVLSAGVLGSVAGSLVARHPLKALKVTRTPPSRMRVGDEISVGLTVQNDSGRTVPLFTVEDHMQAFDAVKVGVARLVAGATAHAETVRVATKRGRFDGGPVAITCGAPFGLTRSRRRVEVVSGTTVVPSWVTLRSFPLRQPSSAPYDVMHQRPRAGGGEEFLGVRGYRPGDPLRSVHWRSTARAGTLVVKEYEQEISTRAALVLAGAQHGEGPGASFEMLVSACASVGLHALSTSQAIHVMTGGVDGAFEELVDPTSDGLLDWLATVEPADIALEGLVEEALARIGRRGTVVIFTSTGGRSGPSISSSIARVERAGAQAVLVVARSGSWTGSVSDDLPDVGATVPLRVLENERDLGRCLAA